MDAHGRFPKGSNSPEKGNGMVHNKNSERLLRIGHALLTPRVKRWAGWLALVWVLLALLAYFVAPPLAKSVLTDRLSQSLGREVSIQDISVNPLTLSARVNGFSVKDRSGGEQLGFEQLHINFSGFSIAQAGIVVDELRLQAPHVAIARLADGRYDISDLLDRWLAPSDKGPTPLPRFSLNNIQISEGRLELDDRPKGVRHEAKDIGFSLPFISSMPYKADVFVLPAFSATLDGSSLAFKGKSKPFSKTHDSELELQLRGLDLARLQPYLPSSLPVRLRAGLLASDLKIGFSQPPDGAAALSLSGTAQLQDLQMSEASGAPFLSLDKLELGLQHAEPLQGQWTFEQLGLEGLLVGQSQQNTGAPLRLEKLLVQQTRLDVPAHRLDATQLLATGLQTRLERSPSGEVTWITLPQGASPAAALPGQQQSRGSGADWVVRADRLALESSALHFDDRSLSPAAVQHLAEVNLSVAPFDSTPGHPNALTLAANVNQTGKLQATGTLQWQPLAVRLQLDTRALPVSPLQGYIDPYLNGSVVQGLVSSQGALNIEPQEGTLRATYKGNLTLGQFNATDKANQADFLKWKSLYFGAVDFALEPLHLRIGEVALTDFYSRLILNQDGRLNLADMVRLPPARDKVAEGQNPASATRPLPIQITKVTLQNGQVNFSDHFVRPNYSANITRLGGSVKNLSSEADTLADLDLRGSYAGNAPVHISARLNPLSDKKFLDLKAEVSSIDLVELSPYSGKYAGYNIDKGKLSLNASYKLQDRQLTADNRLFIDQLTFGEKVESPDATQLPVHLAIALLKNNRGEIDINLPISGSLDDPQFSIGGLIFKVIANLFVKAVTSPFALLGSLFGDGQELSHIGFAPGRASLDEAALKTLDTLAKAMREREGLKLEISASADSKLDEEGLRKAALERAMQAEKRKDITHKPRESVTPQDLQITAGEYATYLTRAYKQARFPKPRNLIGLPKELPVAEMEKLMLTQLSVGEEDLRALATARAQTAQSWLVEQGGLPLSRIFLLPIQIATASGTAPDAGRNRVDFSLR